MTELIPNGSLEKFLKSKRMVGVPGQASTYENVHFGLNDRELLVIAYQVALGMQHLEEKKVWTDRGSITLLKRIVSVIDKFRKPLKPEIVCVTRKS